MIIYFGTRSRTVLSRVGEKPTDMKRPSVAVAWSMDGKEWHKMADCPVPDDSTEESPSGWKLVSGEWADVELERIPR